MELELNGLTIRIDNDRLRLPLPSPPPESPLLRVGELRDADALWERLQKGRDPVSAYLYARLSSNGRRQLEARESGVLLSEALQNLLAAELAALIQQEDALYAPDRFEHLGEAVVALVKSSRLEPSLNVLLRDRHDFQPEDVQNWYAQADVDTRAYFNRRLLEIAYPREIARRSAVGLSLETPPPLYHAVTPEPHFTLQLTPQDGRQHVVHFHVESAAHHWNPRWPRWGYVERDTQIGQDGGATMTLNRLEAEGRELTLEVQPSDTQGRAVTLGFACGIDARAPVGDYDFTIVCREVGNDAEGKPLESTASSECTLCLRHPDSRYLSFLPRIYRANVEPGPNANDKFQDASLFARFLLGIEESAEPTWQLTGRLYQYFDAFSTSPDFLPWLANWIGLALNENWPEMKRRLLLRRAISLYQRRGTPGGLADMLEIMTGHRPVIQDQSFSESFHLNMGRGLGIDTRLGESKKHSFSVTLFVPDKDAVNAQNVMDIINAEKPAHTTFTLYIVPLNA